MAQSSPSSLGLSTLLGAALMLAPPGLWAEQDHTASQPGAQPVPASDQKGHALTPADARLHELVTQIEAEHNTIPHVRMEAVAARGENVVLIDVREAEEFAVSHIPGAINISSKSALLDFAKNSDRDIVLYCSVGRRSAKLTEYLHDNGQSQASNFSGSIFEWANHGRALQNKEGPVKAVHPYNWYWGWRYLRDEVPH